VGVFRDGRHRLRWVNESLIATSTTIKVAAPARESADTAKPTGASAARATTATKRDQGTRPETAHRKTPCPTTNYAVPPRVSEIEANVPGSPGWATVSSSAAATAMMPAIIGRWK
jgi:hypothetical protein